MDPSLLLVESLDSLWFFSSVLSSHTSPVCFLLHSCCGQTHQEHTKTLETTKPISQILETIQKNTQIPENSIPKSMICGRLVSEVTKEKQSVEKKTKTKKTTRRNRTSLAKTKRLDLDHGDVSGIFWQRELHDRHGYRRPNAEFEMKKDALNLPINDCMAMKEQLRTWAHAVACSVR